jgi:hypothetical protein
MCLIIPLFLLTKINKTAIKSNILQFYELNVSHEGDVSVAGPERGQG